MFDWNTASLAGSGAWALADLLGKSVLLFAAAGVISLAFAYCRASAAARHFVWLAAIVASLAMPVLGWLLPTWTMRIQSARSEPEPMAAAAGELQMAMAESSAELLPSERPTSETSAVGNIAAPVAGSVAEHSMAAVETRLPSTAPFDWRPLIVAGWAVGAMTALVPLIAGVLSLWRLRRSARPVAEERIAIPFEQVCRQFGIRRAVTLISTDRRDIPMTWGVWRPIVCLPDAARAWPVERLRAVLVHELAHVQRCDCLAQWLGQLARAVYWCNPLAWLAVQQIRREQERACDDQALESGLLAADYAEHLLAVACGRPRYRFAPSAAMAMARSPRIAGRLQSILDPSRKRNTLSRRGAMLGALVAFGMLMPVATATIGPVAQAQEANSTPKDAAKNGTADGQSPDRIALLRKMLAEQYVTRPNDERILEGAIKGMLESLDDPFSEFLPAEKLADLQRQLEGKLTGIGAQLNRRDGKLTVVTPLEGSPAQKAGLKAGDVILQIDGKSTSELALADAVKRILGEADTKVSLSVRRADGDTAELTITRGPIVLSTVEGVERGQDGKWRFLLDREHKIGYIAIRQLGPRTADEVKVAIDGLKEAGLRGLILDLRFSPGGLLQSAVDVAGLFLGEATVVTARGRDGKEQSWKSDGNNKLGDFPLVVLAGEQTASATEVLAGALKDNGRAMVVGARTFGKGSIQSLIRLDDGAGAVRLTTAFFYSPSGRTIERKPGEKAWGVDPSDGYFVPMTQEASERLQEWRRRREIIGGEPADAALAAAVTPDAIASRGDAQLAAALRTLVAKIVSGEFEKVGQSAAAAQEYALRRRELEDRRAALSRGLEELDREWKTLDNGKTLDKSR